MFARGFGTAAYFLLSTGLVAGCTIIVEPPEQPPTAPFFVPFSCLPVALDIETGEPRLDEEPAATAQIIFAIRIDRTTANLAGTYEKFMTEMVAGLAAMGIQVTVAAILPLDERPSRPVLAGWGCGLDDPEDLPPGDTLRFYATQPPPPSEPIGCAVDPLVEGGRALTELSTDYPPGLEGRNGRTIFGRAPDLLLVVYLDALARRSGRDETSCRQADALASAEGGAAAWLAYSGEAIAMNRVHHWFVATDEGIDDATLAQRCRSVEGFDLGLFDALEASPRALYGPLGREIAAAGGPVAAISMCRLLVEKGRQAFLVEQMLTIAARMDLPLDRQILMSLLESESLQPRPSQDSGTGG